MADDLSAPAIDLYETDFYAWTQAQASLLRARAGGDPALDWERLAEEVGDMGKSDWRECQSRTRVILEHFAKLTASSVSAPRAGWRTTIVAQRADLHLVLTPSLRHKLEDVLDRLHDEAFVIAALALAEHEPGAAVDKSLRWTLAQVLGEDQSGPA